MGTIVRDGTLKERWYVIVFRLGTLRLKFENLINKSSNSVDGCAGRTVEGTMIRHNGPSRDTWHKNDK